MLEKWTEGFQGEERELLGIGFTSTKTTLGGLGADESIRSGKGKTSQSPPPSSSVPIMEKAEVKGRKKSPEVPTATQL